MPYPEALDDAIRTADPYAAVVLETPAIEAALNDLGQQLIEMPVSASHRWSRARKPWRTRRIISAGVASLLVASAAGAASVLTAHTGQYPSPRFVQVGGPGEILRPWAPDFCQVALAVSSDINFPPGYENWRLQVLTFQNQIPHPSATGDCPVSPPGGTPLSEQVYVSTGAERGWFAMGAFCAWVTDYESASTSGNVLEAAAASGEVAGAMAWPAVQAENKATFDFFWPFQRAVASGNTTLVAQLLAQPHNPCANFTPTS